MGKLFRAALLASACLATPALGQVKPSDVPDYIPVTPTYAAGSTTTAYPAGPMPALAIQVADIPTVAPAGFVLSTGVDFKNIPGYEQTPGASGNNGAEPKFRFHFGPSHLAYDDPERNYARPGESHLHLFFGNVTTNAYSTYASLRNRCNQLTAVGATCSTTSGGPFNATAYWIAPPVKGSTVIIPHVGNGYYTDFLGGPTKNRLPRALRYVTGMNMDDPDGLAIQQEVAAANAQPGTNPSRYTCFASDGQTQSDCWAQNGFQGWKCLNPSTGNIIQTTGSKIYHPSLWNLNNTDPWGGACLSGYHLAAVVFGPDFYDGRNLWAPGGYKNMRHALKDNIGPSHGEISGPTNFYRIPRLELTFFFKHSGPSDYSQWRLPSDDMAATLAGHPIANGYSFHTDWFGAWDDVTLYGGPGAPGDPGFVPGFLTFCAQVDGTQPHECADNTVNTTKRLISGSEGAPVGGRNPQVNFSDAQPNTRAMPPVPGPTTITIKPTI
jgi:hypothetical protein